VELPESATCAPERIFLIRYRPMQLPDFSGCAKIIAADPAHDPGYGDAIKDLPGVFDLWGPISPRSQASRG